MNCPKSHILSIVTLATLMGAAVLVAPSLVLGYGASSDEPDCEKTMPSVPWLYQAARKGVGSVDLVWHDASPVETWTVAYGTQSGKYLYGITEFGNSASRSVTINGLPSGTYYFVVRAQNGCAIGGFSNEKVVSVSRGGAVGTVAFNPVPSSTPNPTPSPRLTPKGGSPAPSSSAKVTPPGQQPSPSATPAPLKVGFWQNIANFFTRLFGGK